MINMEGAGTLMILGTIFLVLILWIGPVLGLSGILWLLAPHVGYTLTWNIVWGILAFWSMIVLLLGYITFKK